MVFVLGENLWAKTHRNVSDKFGEVRVKILRTPKNLLASTPMAEVTSSCEVLFGDREGISLRLTVNKALLSTRPWNS